MSELKSLEQHDREREAEYLRPIKNVPNGIACPVCGKELVDVDAMMVLLSMPPKLDVKCLACGYRGCRIQ